MFALGQSSQQKSLNKSMAIKRNLRRNPEKYIIVTNFKSATLLDLFVRNVVFSIIICALGAHNRPSVSNVKLLFKQFKIRN